MMIDDTNSTDALGLIDMGREFDLGLISGVENSQHSGWDESVLISGFNPAVTPLNAPLIPGESDLGILGSDRLLVDEAMATPDLAFTQSQGDPLVGFTTPIGEINPSFGNLPLSFIPLENGPGTPQFQVSGAGHTIQFAQDGLSLTSSQQTPEGPVNATVQLQFIGANSHPEISGLNPLPGVANFFMGNNSSEWVSNVPTYSGVSYNELYPGIHLVYNGIEGQLKRDFIVEPGVNSDQILLNYSGITGLDIREDGALILQTALGELIETAPVIYQEIDGNRIAISGGYRLLGDGLVGFEIGDYDPNYTLVIDPVLEYSSYLGGSQSDRGFDVALDQAGNIYIAGITQSANFPTVGGIQSDNAGESDVFVTKLDPTGTTTLFSTYFGGSGTEASDEGANVSLQVDNAGNIYLSGNTNSTDLPTTAGSIQTSLSGEQDTFVAKFNNTGTELIYSTYLGGTGIETNWDMTLDNQGQVYLTGVTSSMDFPLVNAAQNTFGGIGAFSFGDVFVSKISPTGTELVYSTYLGGSEDDGALAIAVDESGSAYVAGYTASEDFPISPGAFQTQFNGAFLDAFVTKLDPSGSTIEYSTYLGGSGEVDGDYITGIAVDSSGNAYLAGYTDSEDFPTIPGAFQPSFGGGLYDSFVTKLNPTGTGLVYSTFLGGSEMDFSGPIALDSLGNAYIAGNTDSPDFPTVNALQPSFSGVADAFITQLNPQGSEAIYSTFFGGSQRDFILGIVPDDAGNLYVTGGTRSPDFPITTGAIQSAKIEEVLDGFIAKISNSNLTVSPAYQTSIEFIRNLQLDIQSLFFDEGFYLATNPDVATAVNNGSVASAFVHYTKFGKFEGRNPSQLFDEQGYLAQNSDVSAAKTSGGIDSGFAHFIQVGFLEGRSPISLTFNPGFYLQTNPDVAAAVNQGIFPNPLAHYLIFGHREGRRI
ncbi:SBBP repeat-containing protein [Oscillatoria sp. HE19RPO]|uniref:DUF7948 domain-containing protein n=1 Tax=Oscillatoria sp. HE19RPO TaxID=2954806 RepID=UPI0020C5AD11|nr:SBBP repeat-containing protein [Oscillatoria sp. HE19RPO]